jgi:hypothetical protein
MLTSSDLQPSIKSNLQVRRVRLLLSALVLICCSSLPVGLASTHAVVVSSASGNEEFKKKFWDWSSQMVEILTTEMKLPKEHIRFLTEDPSQGAGLATGKATKAEMTKALEGLRSQVKDGDDFLIFLIGHGSFDGSEYKYNLIGPDITGSELKHWLDRFSKQQVVLVATTPCSGILTKTLSGKNRVIVSATKSEFESNDTIFAQFFVEAFQGNKADTDKNTQVSILEAYLYTAQRVEAWYKERNRLATEHPLLEDNGDQTGNARPSPANGEGLLAAKISLGTPSGVLTAQAAADAETTPELQALNASKHQLEGAIQDLKYKKDSLPEAEYAKQMESLLIQLAQTNQKIRALTKR